MIKQFRRLDGGLATPEAREELADENRLHDLEVQLWALEIGFAASC